MPDNGDLNVALAALRATQQLKSEPT